MKTSNYLCHVVGESPERAARYHASTIKRLKAYAIAIHIPVLIWAATSYLIATRIFGLETNIAAITAVGCAGLIYLVERLVLATPKSWWVSSGRFVIGVVIAVLGASTVDLIIFDREVKQQLFTEEKARIESQYAIEINRQAAEVNVRKADWEKAEAAAACEANGTCGTGKPSIGPVYRELVKRAAVLRGDYVAAQEKLDGFLVEKSDKFSSLTPETAGEDAGLLERIEALHQFVQGNNYALVAYTLFFMIVLFFELMVVLVKLVFKETVDDELEKVRERVSEHKAKEYLENVTSPVAGAKRLLEAAYA